MSNDQNISPQRILELRTKLAMSQDEFADTLGVSRNYVSMLERGAKEVSEASSIGLLFRVIESRGASTSAQAVREGIAHYGSTRMIPVVGWAHAGDAASYEELPEDWKHKIPTECRDTKAFAVELQGDSMEPRFTDGDLLIVQPSVEPHSGCLVVARFADDGVIFRRYEMTGSTITLVPLNHRYHASQHQAAEFSWIYPVWGRWSQLWRR